MRRARIRILIGLAIATTCGLYASSSLALTWQPAPGSPYGEGVPQSVVAGDFNGDGLPDLVVGGQPLDSPSTPGYGFMDVLLADRSGGFHLESENTGITFGFSSVSLAEGDFNGDRKPDLLVQHDGEISVLLGNGDGTFRLAATLSESPDQIVIGDFNGDGKSDIAMLDRDNTVSILLANGDGTFRPATGSPISLGSGTIGDLAVGDFNGDGKLDLAVTDVTTDSLNVLSGRGNGTFSPPGPPNPLNGFDQIGAVADLNRDGKTDLVLEDSSAPAGGGAVAIMLGNGHGTFAPAPGSPAEIGAALEIDGLAVGDFDSDGIEDLVVSAYAHSGSSAVTGLYLLRGDGAGRFGLAPGSPYFLPGYPAVRAILGGTFDERPGLVVSQSSCGEIRCQQLGLLLAPRILAPKPTSSATVSGYVQVCGGPAPGGCSIRTIRLCQAPGGCMRPDRVAVFTSRRKRVATQKLKHARFGFRLPPGRYTLELLADGARVRGRVIQRRTVRLTAGHRTVVNFRLAVP